LDFIESFVIACECGFKRGYNSFFVLYQAEQQKQLLACRE
jgi:hypothetical protein